MILSRLSRNSFWLLLSRLATQVGLAAFTILLARGLGTLQFGEYAFMASLILVGNVFTTFGTDMYLIRQIAAVGDLSELMPALLLQLILSGVFVVLLFLVSPVLRLGNASAGIALRLYSLSMFPLAFYTVFSTALRGQQRMLAFALLNLLLIVMQVLAALWVFWQHSGLIQLAALLLLVQVAAAFIAGILTGRRLWDIGSARDVRWHHVLSLARASSPIALLGLLGVIYQRLVLLILPVMAGAAATGLFSAAARLVEAAKIGHIAVFTALYPSMAQQHGTIIASPSVGSNGSVQGSAAGLANQAIQRPGSLARRFRAWPAWTRAYQTPVLVLMIGAILISLTIYLLANFLVGLLFGDQYLSSVPLVRVLAWLLIPYTVNGFLTLAFLARHREVSIARAQGLSLLVLLVLTGWWVPLCGPLGAAWAALAAEIAQAAVLLTMDQRDSSIAAVMLGRRIS